MKTALCYHPAFLDHQPLGYHPEQPERLVRILRGLERSSLLEQLVRIEPVEATRQQLELVHDPDYLDRIERVVPDSRGHLDPDTYYSEGTWTAALLAAGSAARLAEQALSGEIEAGLALVRPPGHHATRNRAMGFCLLNNVAVAAAWALASGARRVAIVDWDVHHGNGTQDIFAADDRVLYSSLHLYPHYPGTGRHTEIGRGRGEGFTVNLPMPHGAASGDYQAAFERILLPVLEQFQPDLLLVSSGFDSHGADPLGGTRLRTSDFGAMTRHLTETTQHVGARGPLVFLEGGYNLDVLEETGAAVAAALLAPEEAPAWHEPAQPSDRVDVLLEELAGILRRVGWKL